MRLDVTQNKMQRNNTIEVLRFVFAASILLYHSNIVTSGKGTRIFASGYLGVEFFFLVSGWLLMASASRQDSQPSSVRDLGGETIGFIWRKVKRIYPYYFVSFVIAYATRHYVFYLNKSLGTSAELFNRAINSIWELFLLQMSGVNWSFAVNGIAWYLSSMFLAMWIIYPIARRVGAVFSKVYAPAIALLLLAWLSKKYETLNLVSDTSAVLQPGTIRAVAGILLGASAYHISKYLQALPENKGQSLLLKAVEIVCYGIVLVLCNMNEFKGMPFTALLLLYIAVSISFSGKSFLTKVVRNFNCDRIGQITLLMFLNQRCWLYLIPKLKLASYFENLLAFIFCVVVASVVTHILGNILKRAATACLMSKGK